MHDKGTHLFGSIQYDKTFLADFFYQIQNSSFIDLNMLTLSCDILSILYNWGQKSEN